MNSRSDPQVKEAPARVPLGPSPLAHRGPKHDTMPRKRLPPNGADELRTRDSNFAKEVWRAYGLLEAALEEAAAALDISPATLHRELKMAKAWLYNELARGSPAEAHS